jgi:hypothetical protein
VLFVALCAALLKDVMDIISVSVAIINIPITIFLFIYMRRKGWFKGIKARMIKVIFIIICFFFDALPLVSLFPMQTVLVWVSWRKVKERAGNAKDAKEKIEQAQSRNGRIDESTIDDDLLDDE